jgi:hypothetical protein
MGLHREGRGRFGTICGSSTVFWICSSSVIFRLEKKGKRMSSGFLGGRAPLGPNPRSQAFFLHSSLHFFMKVRNSSFLSPKVRTFWLYQSKRGGPAGAF